MSNPFNICIWNQIYFRIDALRDHASEQVSDLQMRFASNRFSVCPPETKVKSSNFILKLFNSLLREIPGGVPLPRDLQQALPVSVRRQDGPAREEHRLLNRGGAKVLTALSLMKNY